MDAGVAGVNRGTAFETDSAKFEFSNNAIRALPDYKSVAAPGDDSFYPLVLIPYDTMRLTSGYIGSPPFMVKSLEDTILKGNDVLVEVNPTTAKKLGWRALMEFSITSGHSGIQLIFTTFDRPENTLD